MLNVYSVYLWLTLLSTGRSMGFDLSGPRRHDDGLEPRPMSGMQRLLIAYSARLCRIESHSMATFATLAKGGELGTTHGAPSIFYFR